MLVLGLETSCDETAAAVVKDGCTLLSNVVASSMELQAQYGGVVPELAARSHIEAVNSVVDEALTEAACTWGDIDGIAVTYGPGLGGSLLIGVLTARTLAITHNKPLYAINHVEAHVYANFLTEVSNDQLSTVNGQQTINYQLPDTQPSFPLLALIVSGGHTQLVLFRDHFDYTLLGQTHDDAIGEAFDKVAKIIGLPYPGGPSIGKKALEGNPHAFDFPKAKMAGTSPALERLRTQRKLDLRKIAPCPEPSSSDSKDTLSGGYEPVGSSTREKWLMDAGGESGMVGVLRKSSKRYPIPDTRYPSYDFSFSGLKTAVLRTAQQAIGEDHTFPSKNLPERLSEAQKADIAASFDRIATETVVDKTLLAYEEFKPASIVIAGGVAASPELRRQLAERLPCSIAYTDSRLCTDNGAMVATLGCFHMKYGHPPADPYTLDIKPNLSM